MNILVTGGAGFIGSNFVHHVLHDRSGLDAACCDDEHGDPPRQDQPDLRLLVADKLTYAADMANLAGADQAPQYRFKRMDICDPAAVEAAFTEFEPTTVVHFAAESHVDRSIDDGLVFTMTNVVGTQVLLDAARRHDVDRFLHVSTDEVYGSIDQGRFTEEDPYDPSSPYSASKAGSDLLALAHHRTYGLPVTITRCTNNFGPRQHDEKLLPKIIALASADQPLPIYGDGMNVRDWLYVKDHCTAIDKVLEEAASGEVYNIGARDERHNIDVVRTVLERLGKPESLIEFVTDRPGHDRRYALDDSKLRAMGWRPATSFEDGLDHTIRWLTHRRRVTP